MAQTTVTVTTTTPTVTVGPATASTTELVTGAVALASDTEVLAGTVDTKAVTPSSLKATLPFTILHSTATPAQIAAAFPGTVQLKAGTYTIDSAVALTSGSTLIADGQVIFNITTAANAVTATGTKGSSVAFTANQTAGSFTVALPTGQGANFAVGDIIGLEADPATPVIPGTPGVKPRELFTVLAKATDTLTLDKALSWAYNTADTAVFFKITPVTDVHIKGITLKYGSAGNEGRGVVLTYARRCSVDVASIGGPGVFVSESILCDVKARVDGDNIYADYRGYATSVAGSGHGCNVDVDARDCRHCFTTLPHESGGDTYSGPFKTTVRGQGWGGTSSFAVWDTHLGSVDTTFDGVQGEGPGQSGTPVLQDRGYRTKVIGATLRGSQRCVTAVADTSVGLMVLDCDLSILAASSDGAVVVAGDDAIVRGNRILAPAGYGVDNTGDRTLVENNYIEALSCWRENAGSDTGAIFQNNTVKLHTSAGFGGISTAQGLQKNNTFIAGTSTVPFLSAPGASARMETGWHASTVVTYAASVTPNPALLNNIRITLTGNITIANPSSLNKINGNILRVTTVQDGTGTRTHTWGADFKVLTAAVTTANLRNQWDFMFDGTNWVEVAATVGLA